MHQFRYYVPSDQELARATVYSERVDNKSNKLERRFGHPALQADLFTPMLHKKMMPLLAEVYHGRLANDTAKLEEYGGQKMQAQVAPGGVKIAAIDEVYDIHCSLVICTHVFVETIGDGSCSVPTRTRRGRLGRAICCCYDHTGRWFYRSFTLKVGILCPDRQ